MKRYMMTIVAFLMALTINSQEWVGVNRNTPKRIQETLVSSSEHSVVVDVEVSGFYKDMVKTTRGEMINIVGEDMAAMPIKGAPNLPMYPISMIVGDQAEMEVSVVKSKYVDFENIEVAPSKGNFSRQINPDDVPYTYGEMYQEDAFYPSEQVILGNPYILRDFRGQNMMVYPYSYNPVTKTLRVYTYLRIEAKKVSDNGENQKVRATRSNKITPEMNMAYKRRFINYPANEKRYTFLEEEGEMLIVCVDKYMEALEPLVEWKNISGRPTSMVATSVTGTLDSLKQYLADYYKANPELVYVLLVGEHDNLPAKVLSGGRSDNYYGMLEGNDKYEEVMIGRLSVNSISDAVNQVNKIIYYERDIDTKATWLTRASGIAAKEGQGHYNEIDYEHMDFIRDTLLNYNYTEVSQYYANVNNPIAPQMVSDFSNGLGLINYCNHGTVDSWSVANFSTNEVQRLTNDNMLPIVWSVACNNGQFDYDECFGEAWMRATNPTTGNLTGAIGGMFSWITQPWIPPMYGQDEMVAILTEWRDGYKHTLGGASLNGNMFMMDMDPFEGPMTHDTWILFGDPSLIVRTDVPQSMNVTVPQQDLFIGMTSLNIKAEADYGIATLSIDGEAIASAHIRNGEANLIFAPLLNEGVAKLVVLGYNKVTEIKKMNIVAAESPYVIYSSHEIDGNGNLEYGQTSNISMKIKNVGLKPTDNVTVTISTDSEYVTVLNDETQIVSIEPEQLIDLDEAFTVSINPNVPDMTRVDFTVTCTDGTDTWTTVFYEYICAPLFNISSVNVTPNKVVLPGEKASLEVSFVNVGNAIAHNVLTEAFSSSSDIEFVTSTVVTEEVLVGETYTVKLDFNVDASLPLGSVYDIIATVNSDFYTAKADHELKVGLVGDDFETGDFLAQKWSIEGDGVWVIDSTNAYEGNYCIKSDKVSNNKYAKLKIQIEVLADGPLTFYVKTSSELHYDFLKFYINSLQNNEWSGETDWVQYTYEMKKGSYALEWRYIKDTSGDGGEDCAYIDNIVFPPVSVVRMLEAVTDFKYNISGENVLLSWSAVDAATEYIITRNGEQVSTQTTTEFNDKLSDAIVTYSVVAKNGDNYSAPAFLSVNPDVMSGEDVLDYEMKTVSLYPNPTSGMLYVNLEDSFDAVIYNYQGQVVMREYNNDGMIDMSNLTTGIYFVEIRNNNNVIVEKIIVK